MKSRQSIRQRFVALSGGLTLTLSLALFAAVPVALADVDHCPGHSDAANTKTESVVDGDLDDVVLAAGTMFCVKASTGNTGILTADGSTTLQDYLKDAGIVGGDGEGRNVSYYVVYPPDESPTPTPEDTPTPTPTPTPEDTPTPTPTPTPEDTPTPTPTPEGTPTPTPTGTPPDTAVAPTSDQGSSGTLIVLMTGLLAAGWMFLRPLSLVPANQRSRGNR